MTVAPPRPRVAPPGPRVRLFALAPFALAPFALAALALAPLALAALALAAFPPAEAKAQSPGVRARATSSVRYVELRPVAQDTVSRERVVEAPDGTLTFEGRPVTCVPGAGCTFYRVLPEESALAAAQDVWFTAWGLGVQGLSATGLLRARLRLAGAFKWPRSDDRLDAIVAYLELQRGEVRLRAGRQETLSGLGFQGYDGGSARWTPRRDLALEAYAGRSLARGLSEPHHVALRGIEDFIPDRNAYVFGGFGAADLGAETRVGLRYQREIWSDRSGLLQERASLDAYTARLRPLRLEGAFDWDFAFARAGTSHVSAFYPLGSRGAVVEGTLRRYVPYFPLSTIWGFFSPVPYHEAVVRVRSRPFAGDSASVRMAAGWRRYGETHAEDFLTRLTDQGWHAEVGLVLAPAADWTLNAQYRVERGAGAFLSAADAEARWRAGERVEVGALASAFQQILEFRVGEGRVWGGGLTLGADLPWGARLDAGAVLYRHDPRGRGADTAWTQNRAWTSLAVPFGEDPGAPAPRTRTLRR